MALIGLNVVSVTPTVNVSAGGITGGAVSIAPSAGGVEGAGAGAGAF
jgi:hypothetical protein